MSEENEWKGTMVALSADDVISNVKRLQEAERRSAPRDKRKMLITFEW